jgi:hypothetical protein
MLKQVFKAEGSMPEIFIYDNCCGLYNYLLANNDELVTGSQGRRVGFPVDAFHFDVKHKKTDTFCQEHCNPRYFDEILNPDGSWWVNSSKCEQLNVWLGGYHAILREMSADRYRFFLDELIMRKNRELKAKLERDGHMPSYYPNLRFIK